MEQSLLQEANRLNEARYPQALLPLQSHLHHVTDIAQTREDEIAAALCASLDNYLDSVGAYNTALPYSQRALAIREKVLGSDHPDTATSLNNLGYLHRAVGDYEGARPYYQRALDIREKVLGPEHPKTALSLNNLGALL